MRLRALPDGYRLTPKYLVRRRLGVGSSGVAYQVYDVLADADRTIKLVLREDDTAVTRIRHEYRILRTLPAHPNVLRVHDADFLPDGKTPFLVFDHVDGQVVNTLVADERPLSPADVRRLGLDAARGLVHLHTHQVFHCDIKPGNLLWTDAGCMIIDFDVAVAADATLRDRGGTTRYLPPDLTRTGPPTAADLADRDCYALGLTLYQVLTGAYPWPGATQPAAEPPVDPRELVGLADLSGPFVRALLTAIAPHRADRYRSAGDLLAALEAADPVWLPTPEPTGAPPTPPGPPGPAGPSGSSEPTEPNSNPFVAFLQTLYSQSARSNRGTRGRDPAGADLYVHTALDRRLLPELLAGHHRLVIITGNAGDGKTAFCDELVAQARRRGAVLGPARGNGADFTLAGRRFRTNHDGSQDEGAQGNDEVLLDFFGPYVGADSAAWPAEETRLIAINEGRLVDFLTAHRDRFALLADRALAALDDQVTRTGAEPAGPADPADGSDGDGVTVVNLTGRSVVADPDGQHGAILDLVLTRLTDPAFWAACQSCDLARTCYARHNAATFADRFAGPRVTTRLRTLHTLVHLRGRQHITLRDLRSALAFMLTSGRDCAGIHDLYERGDATAILDSFYFTSWAGPRDQRPAASADPSGPGTVERAPTDRLLAELRAVDVACVPAPDLDRQFDFAGPPASTALMAVADRSDHAGVLLDRLFTRLPRTGQAPVGPDAGAHQRYLAAARRRYFFECQDEQRWRRLLPYSSAERFLDLLAHPETVSGRLPELIAALNRGEGVSGISGGALALAGRQVPGGTPGSYRLFAADRFSLAVVGGAGTPYLESGPDAVVLAYRDPDGGRAELRLRLDLFELVHRLGAGYLPAPADVQGLYVGLGVFRTALAALPYREILLAVPGAGRYRIRADADTDGTNGAGRLVMHPEVG